jgi:hypothetical protein
VAQVSPAAAGSAHEQAARPWTQVWIEAFPISPAWVGCALAAGHVLLGAAYFAVFVAPEIGAVWRAYQDVLLGTCVFALVIGYATAGLAYARRGHETTLRDLRPALSCSDSEFSELRREVLRFDTAALRRTGLIAAACGVVITYFSTGVAQRLDPATLLWILGQNALWAWLLVRTIAHDLRVSRILSREAEAHADIELLDLTPLMPLAGRGLQSALLIVLALSLFLLILGAGDVSPLVPAIQTGTVLLAAFALVLPSLGVRRRVRSAKREELERLSSQIRAVRAQPAAAQESRRPETDSRLVTLLALKHHVEMTREWPFDLGTLGRFILYAAIGVGSWLGGAAVERLLDLLLD